MSCSRVPAKLVATLLIPALYFAPVLAVAPAPGGTLSGHVFAAEGHAPLRGVQVHVGDPSSGTIRGSATTGDDGSFTVTGLPPAKYEIAVQSPKAVYVAGGSVALAAGESRSVQVAVNEQVAPSPAEVAKKRRRGGAAWLNNPFTATMIVLGAAVLIGVVVDNATDDEDTSPSPSAR